MSRSRAEEPSVEYMQDAIVSSGDSAALHIRSAWREHMTSGEASDGAHTHNELYAFRRVYNALLFNEWAQTGEVPVVKSWRHSDGEVCFGGGWFIVVAELPSGQISNHYEDKWWKQFHSVPEVALAPEWDGHGALDALYRMQDYIHLTEGIDD